MHQRRLPRHRQRPQQAHAANITPAEVAVPLDEIPADSTCITFQRARMMEMMGDKRGANAGAS